MIYSIENAHQIYLEDEELDLLKNVLKPSVELDDDGNVDDKQPAQTQMLTRIYKRMSDARRCDTGAIWVSVYESTQVYGGPEEGGWYYWHNQLEEAQGFIDPLLALDVFNMQCALIDNESPELTFEMLCAGLAACPDCMTLVERTYKLTRTESRIVVIETQLGSQNTIGRPIYC